MQNSGLQGLGSFPVIIVLFGAIALFLVLRLRSVLGKRVGFEKPPIPQGQMQGFASGPILEGRAIPPGPTNRPVPDPRSPLGERLMSIVNADPAFDPPVFLAGAENAFRIIVTAFAAGDKATLQNLLTPTVYQTFEQAITNRETASERHRTEIKSINTASIEDAQLVSGHAAIIVRFTSDQVNVTLNAAGSPVSGSEAVTELVDLWTFERTLNASDPAWRLASARNG